MSRFIIKNTFSYVACTILYDSFSNLLNIYSGGKSIEYPETFLRLAYLYENGLLPELNEKGKNTGRKEQFINLLIDFITGKVNELPAITPDYWKRFDKWILNLCHIHNLKVG